MADSTSAIQDRVNSLYSQYLGRTPSPEELTNWTNHFETSGNGIADSGAVFLRAAQPEMKAQMSSNQPTATTQANLDSAINNYASAAATGNSANVYNSGLLLQSALSKNGGITGVDPLKYDSVANNWASQGGDNAYTQMFPPAEKSWWVQNRGTVLGAAALAVGIPYVAELASTLGTVGAATALGDAGIIDAATLAEGFGGAGAVGSGGAAGLTGLQAAGAAGAAGTAAATAGGTDAAGSSLYSLSGGPGAGGGLVAPTGGGAGLTSLADMGGAGGLNAATGGTSLADMGGASGLLAPAATGGGAVVGADGLYSGVGAGLTGTLGTTIPTGSALTGNVASAVDAGTTIPGAATGTGISSLLTPSNVAVASGLLSAGAGVLKSNAISDAQAQQAAAAAASQKVLDSAYNKSMGFQVPYQSAGANAINQIGSMSTGDYTQYDMNGNPTGTGTGSGYLQHQFNKDDLAAGLAPNYDFMLQQGQNVNQRAANVGGGALSGNTLQGLQNYTQNYAGTAYQNAFTNYQQQRQNIYGNLAGIAGMGQAANTGAVGAANNYATNTTNLTTGLAQANAAATIGQAQNTGNTISNLGNTAVLASLLNQKNTAVPDTSAVTG